MHFPQKGLSVTCRCLDRLGEELTENPTFQAAPNRVGQQVAVNLLSVTSLCKEILTRPRSSQGIEYLPLDCLGITAHKSEGVYEPACHER
jgi:hypothetical protein